MRRCPRCGDAYELFTLDQRHCRRCDEEVRRLIEADTARRAPRFVGKDLTPWTGKGAAA
jgi:uncharacterized protein (DUF983 family)